MVDAEGYDGIAAYVGDNRHSLYAFAQKQQCADTGERQQNHGNDVAAEFLVVEEHYRAE